ncbi:MAG: dienelactone hydrolase family protein [Comamonas sp.]
MPVEHVVLPTPDGKCPTDVLTPAGAGPWPAVIFYGDAGGMRPAMRDMARQLADAGYLVVLPDLYYRFGPYAPLVPAEVFRGNVAAILAPLMATTGTDKAARDTQALLAYLDTRGDVAGRKVGAVGFCMGAGLALAAAAAHPARLGAVASFHGGHLATDAPDSPHRLLPTLDAEVYVASAANDDSYPPAMAARFEAALAEAGVAFRSEEYPAPHGWMVPDFPAYDAGCAERGWNALLALWARTLRPGR